MKKNVRWLAGLMAMVLLLGIAAGCKKKDGTNMIQQENLVEQAKCTLGDGSTSKNGALKGGKGDTLLITFFQESTVNTVVLREKDSNILRFRIEAMGSDGTFQTVYEQDKVEAYRYCAFPAVKTTALRLTLLEVREGKTAQLKSSEAYNVQNDASQSFRVTSYLLADRAYDKKNLDAQHFNVITDVILFGLTSFDENGVLQFNEVEIDGKKLAGQQVFEQALKNVREISAQRSAPLKIYVNFLGPNPKEAIADWNKSMDAKGEIHAKAMRDNQKTLVNGIEEFLTTYQLDGVFFDYEYPLKQKHWNMYSDFIVALKSKIGEKTLGIALAPWGIKLSKEAIDSTDLVEIMSYDLFDKDGDHSPFYSCAPDAVDAFVKKGFDKSKLDLGVPYYARPSDGGSFWYDYASEAEKLGKFGNIATGKASDENDPCETRYYNGYQMVYDKTAYAVNAGVGGMMIWHYSCDLPYRNELSLFRSMGNAINDRQ